MNATEQKETLDPVASYTNGQIMALTAALACILDMHFSLKPLVEARIELMKDGLLATTADDNCFAGIEAVRKTLLERKMILAE